MPIDLFRPRAGEPTPMPSAALYVDRVFALLPRLRILRDDLLAAIRFRDACHQIRKRRALPPLFFFHQERQAELEESGYRPHTFEVEIARRFPREAAAWQDLAERVHSLMPLLLCDVDLRQAARALPGFKQSAESLAVDHADCRELADLLAVLDEEVLLIVAPEARLAFRLEVSGLATVGQLHAPLADLRLARALGSIESEETARQLFTLSALRSDCRMPRGLAGSEHWLWNHKVAGTIAKVEGERVILLGDRSRFTQTFEPRFPDLPMKSRLAGVLTREEVHAKLQAWTGATIPESQHIAMNAVRAA